MHAKTTTRKQQNAPLLRLFRLALRAMTCATIAIALAAYVSSMSWMIDLLSHFQLQALVMGVISAIGLSLVRSKRWAIVACLAMLTVLLAIVPWYVPRSKLLDVHERATIRVMQFNILESNNQYEAVIAEVTRHQVDVVVFQEADVRWVDAMQQMEKNWPYTHFQPGGPLRGNLVRSRFPMSEVVHEPSIGDSISPSLSMQLDVNGQAINLLVSHTAPPHNDYFSDLRNRELHRLAKRATEMPKPLILLGDLNVTMWSAHYKNLEQTSGLVSARRGFGIVPTFPMDSYAMLRVPIDHCLVSDDIVVLDFQRGLPCGSDHAPIIVELAFSKPENR